MEGSVAGLPGTYPVVFSASDTSGASPDVECSFNLNVDAFNAVVYQPNVTRAATHDSSEPLFLYMYLPVYINYMGDYQYAFGNAPGDGSMEYFEMRDTNTGQTQYLSEERVSGSFNINDVQMFRGPSGVYPSADLELWICMNPSTSSSCAMLYPRVSMCASEFTNIPAGCELSLLY